MSYSLEYKEWTGSDVEPSFEIKEVSHNMRPGDTSDVTCEGLGFIGMYKNEKGQLQFKMKSNNEEGYELVYFQKIKNLYVPFE
jgi:hypothetical protein